MNFGVRVRKSLAPVAKHAARKSCDITVKYDVICDITVKYDVIMMQIYE